MNSRTHSRFAWIGLVLLGAFVMSDAAFAQHGGHGAVSHHASGGHGHVAHYSPSYRGGYYRGPYYSRYYGYGYPYWYGGLAIGAYVATLPFYYNTYWWGGVPYYYYGNTYYRWNDSVREYEVVAPPKDAQAPAQTPSSDKLFAYPKNGQTEEQQSTDRYECHRWAVEQTHFDPSAAAAGQPAEMRDEYLRAQTACLSGRGYSVR